MNISLQLLFALFALSPTPVGADEITPLVRVVDLSLGETATIELADGRTVKVKLIDVRETRDSLSNAVRRAEVDVEVDGERATLVSATYHLPVRLKTAQIDCPITRGYNSNGSPEFWGLKKDARLRLWPGESPWIRPGTFGYPVKQKWFATHTQMANVPTFVDGGDKPSRKKIYYHSGLDIGGTEGHVEVIAATDGMVVSSGLDVLPAHKEGTPVSPRYDVVYIQDNRGWYYRYSHLKEIDRRIVPGRLVAIGERIGVLGKEGGSGGWSHLHFEIKARQPSGEWGTQAGYAFLWQTYLERHQPKVIAVARPHHFAATGEDVELTAAKSWSQSGGPLSFEWTMHNGETAAGPTVRRTYTTAGSYSEIVKVTDNAGNVSFDFAVVQVVDASEPAKVPPTIHPTYAPTFDLHPGDSIRFTVRSFRTDVDRETWDFGDGSPPVQVQSDGNKRSLDPNGYAVTEHVFETPGDYIVKVERSNSDRLKAVGHLHVRIEPR